MIKHPNAQLWVHDQDEALAFYTQKLGLEVRSDVTLAEMGNFRWLTRRPGRASRTSRSSSWRSPARRSWTPRPPTRSGSSMAKGFAGTVFLTTDDCRASYEELKARGVEFTETPEEPSLRRRRRASATRPATRPPDPGPRARHA